MKKTNKRSKGKRRIGTTIAAAALAGLVACIVYLNDSYCADPEAISAFAPAGVYTEQALENNVWAYMPEESQAGFIFYPGGKVESSAYQPLMRACAGEGILCVLIEMPWNLAVFDIDAADGIQEQFPEIENWYIGGHSLGGAMAASYLAKHTDEFEGLVLLGSYSTADLSGESLGVLSVYGSEDGVLNREKYRENLANLPAAFDERVLEGGCHAYFGMYGPQEGDGIPTISNQEQITETALVISQFMSR